MPNLTVLGLYAFCSGITVFLGGLFSWFVNSRVSDGPAKTEFIHTSIAAGGGIILAAVAFVLVPSGLESLSLVPASGLFLAGSVFFFALDRFLEKRGGTSSQLLAMMMDYVPEAIALGAVFAADHRLGLLIAIFIGLQNFPESFNAFSDLIGNGMPVLRALLIFLALSFTGAAAAIGGRVLLQDSPTVTGALMVFAGGGLVYLVFQDIAPTSKVTRHWFPAVGACLGFLIGMIGHGILG